jgi:ABC-type antimicrobial peptide transport system permease subunit
VLTYSVLTRTREIGLRVALGAGRAEVLGMVLKEGFGMVAIGTVLGLAGAAAGNRVALQMARWGGAPQIVLLLSACGVIVASAAIAAYFPARRAASVDPMRVLRNE